MHQCRRKGRPRPSGERSDARNQLGEIERLGEIVVGTDPETIDAILDRCRGSEHQHPALASVGEQSAADIVAVPAGQAAVEHDDVVTRASGVGQRVVPVEDHVDGHSLTAQHCCHRRRELGVVLDHQHPHRASSLRGPARRGVTSMPTRRLQRGYSVTVMQPRLSYNRHSTSATRREALTMHQLLNSAHATASPGRG